MAHAHHVGGPRHGEIIEFGPGAIEISPGYRLHSETFDLPHNEIFSEFDIVILVHGTSIDNRNLEATQHAVATYWASLTSAQDNRDL